VPHLAVVAFNFISIILVLIFVRFRFEGRFFQNRVPCSRRVSRFTAIGVDSYLLSIHDSIGRRSAALQNGFWRWLTAHLERY